MQTVGELLRNEREKKGLSIKEIEAAISIRSLYISAIEEDNYTVIPGEVYLKGFIRNYANYLGLDGQEVVQFYRQSQLPPPPPVVESPISEPVHNIAADTPSIRAKAPSSSNKGILMGVLAICVLASAWWLFGNKAPEKESQINTQAQQTPITPNVAQPQATSSQTKPVTLIAKYTEQCWTAVTADGKTIYEGIPKTNETLTWEAQKNITITVGNAGGVEVTANGQSMGKLGKKGEVVNKTFLPK